MTELSNTHTALDVFPEAETQQLLSKKEIPTGLLDNISFRKRRACILSLYQRYTNIQNSIQKYDALSDISIDDLHGKRKRFEEILLNLLKVDNNSLKVKWHYFKSKIGSVKFPANNLIYREMARQGYLKYENSRTARLFLQLNKELLFCLRTAKNKENRKKIKKLLFWVNYQVKPVSIPTEVLTGFDSGNNELDRKVRSTLNNYNEKFKKISNEKADEQYQLWEKTFDDYIQHPFRLLFTKKGVDKDLYNMIDLMYRFGGMTFVKNVYDEFFSKNNSDTITAEKKRIRLNELLEKLANGLINIADEKFNIEGIDNNRKCTLFVEPMKRYINHLSNNLDGDICIRKAYEKDENGASKTVYKICHRETVSQKKQERHDFKKKISPYTNGFSWVFAFGAMMMNVIAILAMTSNPVIAIPVAAGLGLSTFITNKILVGRPTKSLMMSFIYDNKFTLGIADDVESPIGKGILKYAVAPFLLLLAYANGITVGILTFMAFIAIPGQFAGLGFLPATAIPSVIAVLGALGAFVAITTMQCIAMLVLSTLVNLMKNTIAFFQEISTVGIKNYFANKWSAFKKLPGKKQAISVLSKVLLVAVIPVAIVLSVLTNIAGFGAYSSGLMSFWTDIVHLSSTASLAVVGVVMSLYMLVKGVCTLKTMGEFIKNSVNALIVNPIVSITNGALIAGKVIVNFFSKAITGKEIFNKEEKKEVKNGRASEFAKNSAFVLKQVGSYIVHAGAIVAALVNPVANGSSASSKLQAVFGWFHMKLGLKTVTDTAIFCGAFESAAPCLTDVKKLYEENVNSSNFSEEVFSNKKICQHDKSDQSNKYEFTNYTIWHNTHKCNDGKELANTLFKKQLDKKDSNETIKKGMTFFRAKDRDHSGKTKESSLPFGV